MQTPNTIRWHTWVSSKRHGTDWSQWLNPPTMLDSRCILRRFNLGPTEDLGWWYRQICWCHCHELTGSKISAQKQRTSWNSWYSLSACCESGWRMREHGWLLKLIGHAASMIPKRVIQHFFTPVSSWLAMSIRLHQGPQIPITDCFCIQFVRCFAITEAVSANTFRLNIPAHR